MQQEEEKEKFVRLHRTKKEEYRRNVNLLMALKDGSRENGNEGTSRSSRVGHLTGGEVVERTANGSNREEIGKKKEETEYPVIRFLLLLPLECRLVTWHREPCHQ